MRLGPLPGLERLLFGHGALLISRQATGDPITGRIWPVIQDA